MAHFLVTHNRAIWETTTFEVEVPDPLPEGHESPVDDIRDRIDVLMTAALDAEAATIAQGDSVASIDSKIEIRDQAGNTVYRDVDDGKDE